MVDKNSDLKARILAEMTSDYSNILDRNFNLAKKFIRLSKDGKVEVINKDKLNGPDQILLYLIGKLYAKEAGLSESDDVGSKEILDELGIVENSLWPWLKTLRDDSIIKQRKMGKFRNHYVPINLVERHLKEINKKISNMEGE